MPTPTIDAFREKVRVRHDQATGTNSGALPWAAILKVLLAIFAGCLPLIAKRRAAKHPEEFKGIVRDHLAGMDVPGLDADSAADAFHAEFTACSAPTLAKAQAEYAAGQP